MGNVKRVFTVDGKPFFPLGGQSRNSSGYNDAESETAFRAVKLLHGNTLEIPVYWEQVEPQEGAFDFSSVGALLARARRHGIKLVLLWFGTWKNGDMDYTPAWVKANPTRFKRVVSATGRAIWVLSSHCLATLEADTKAYAALCRYLKANDSECTVIALQIENEPGILGSDRDYGPDGQATFESAVPAGLVAKLKAAGTGPVCDIWQQAGGKPAGSWPEMFGWAAGELMTAWSIATYIDRLAEAGKALLDIPMYINVWLGGGDWQVAGEYPSGGAIGKVLDIYKWCTPHVDLIAPDIYIADSRGYEAACRSYARDDNPLFVPESGPGGANAWNMFRAIADYSAIGYAFFAVEHAVGEDRGIRPELRMLVDSFSCVAAAIPLLLRYQGTGKIQAVVQEENMASQSLHLDGYGGLVEFGSSSFAHGRDWRHMPWHSAASPQTDAPRGRGFVVQVSRNEFYLVGAGYRLLLRPRVAPEQMRDASLVSSQLRDCLTQYLSVDEGRFDGDGQFVIKRRRNGDETNSGVWVEPDCGLVRVLMCD